MMVRGACGLWMLMFLTNCGLAEVHDPIGTLETGVLFRAVANGDFESLSALLDQDQGGVSEVRISNDLYMAIGSDIGRMGFEPGDTLPIAMVRSDRFTVIEKLSLIDKLIAHQGPDFLRQSDRSGASIMFITQGDMRDGGLLPLYLLALGSVDLTAIHPESGNSLAHAYRRHPSVLELIVGSGGPVDHRNDRGNTAADLVRLELELADDELLIAVLRHSLVILTRARPGKEADREAEGRGEDLQP